MLPPSHRHERARRAPRIEFQMSSAQVFDVNVVYATITSINRTRCEQIVPRRRRGNPVHQNVQISHFLWVLSTLRNPQDISDGISIFLTSGRAEETDNEHGIEHTTMTNDAATEQVPDRVEGQVTRSCLQLQRNVQL